MINNILNKVSSEFHNEKADHPKPSNESDLAKYLRSGISETLSKRIPYYTISASSGVGGWPDVLWVAFLDPRITTSARRGFYVAYLFSSDMKEIYLTISIGVSSQGSKKRVIQEKKVLLKSFDLALPDGFYLSNGRIDLKANTLLSQMYELSVICFKKYDAGNLPDNESLMDDLNTMLGIYKKNVEHSLQAYEVLNSVLTNLSEPMSARSGSQDEDISNLSFEERRIRKLHYKFEGRLNSNKLRKIKASLASASGYICSACGFEFAKKYIDIDDKYIEAHHIVLYSEPGLADVRNVKPDDFILLCANCHRMIHRIEPCSLDLLKQKIVKD